MFSSGRPTLFLLLGTTLCVSAKAQETVLPIGQVRGSVANDEAGLAHKSPHAADGAAIVTVQGVITGRTLSQGKDGSPINGFFLQNTLATADKDPSSSDGIWVFLGRSSTVRGAAGNNDNYVPRVGDEIVLNARVVEYYGQTQLSSPRLVRGVRSGVNLDHEVPSFEAAPPDDTEDANRYWERHEGMRARVPAGSPVVMGRRTSGHAEGEIDLIRADHPVARRADPYARRVFRDFHPLDDVPGKVVDNGNGYRIAIGALGLKAASNNIDINLPPVHSLETMTTDAIGGISFSFGRYVIQPEVSPGFQPGSDPSQNGAPRIPDPATEYSLATYNVENLYDFRDDPNDAADFADNPGKPGVTPPFDYLPKFQAEYDAHRRALASQIVKDLHSPDVLFIEEAEDQDICTVQNGQMACGTADNADGSPDVLQELALDIQRLGGPRYRAYFDRDAADARGIIPAFLLREDTATLVSPDPADPVLGLAPRLGDITPAAYNTQVSNPKALNAALAAGITDADGTMIFTRAPQVAKIKLAHPNGTSTVLYCIANHFSSGPDRRVEQRRAQAGFLVRLASAIQATDKNARIVIAGDLNVYPRPDDPFTPATRSAPSDQLGALYDAGFFNLFDVLVREVPAAAYSYLYQGQAQTLDHIFLSRSQRADLQQVRVAHINADWPGGEAIQQDEFMRGASDHDPCIAVFSDTPRTAPDNMDDERPGTARWPQGPLPVSWPLGALDSPNILVAAVPAPMPSPVQPVSLTPVVSPAQPSFLPQPGPSRPAVIFNAKLDLNNATELQLLTLPGIGPSRARSILAYRQQNGPFKAVGDLAKVPNIGPKTLERIVSLLMVK